MKLKEKQRFFIINKKKENILKAFVFSGGKILLAVEAIFFKFLIFFKLLFYVTYFPNQLPYVVNIFPKMKILYTSFKWL